MQSFRKTTQLKKTYSTIIFTLLLAVLGLAAREPAYAQSNCDVSAFQAAPFTVHFTEFASFKITFPLTSKEYHEQAQGQAAMAFEGTFPFTGHTFAQFAGPVSGAGSIS